MSKAHKRRRSLRIRDQRAERRLERSAHEPVYYILGKKERAAPPPQAISAKSPPWCSNTGFAADKVGSFDRSSKVQHFPKARCPYCGRRLQLMTVDIENGYGDFWPYFPPHKKD